MKRRKPRRLPMGENVKMRIIWDVIKGIRLYGFEIMYMQRCIRDSVKGEPRPTPGIPESLKVLLHELRGLGLSITCLLYTSRCV